MSLPPFLQPSERWTSGRTGDTAFYDALFTHKNNPLAAHVLWWPPTTHSSSILVFIPGNPGLVDFYTPFLTAVYDKSHHSLPILARAHLGHTPHLDGHRPYSASAHTRLEAQLNSIVELIDTLQSCYKNIILVGHSVGSWLVLQALRFRPQVVSSVFLLFPTIAYIGSTPNGRKLSWLFRPPLPRIVSHTSVLTRLLPLRLISYLFAEWPLAQVLVLRDLLHSPFSIYASLTMADDEMKTIREPDEDLLKHYSDRIHLYFAQKDDWVGDNEGELLRALEQHWENVKIIHGQADIPHAFCISKFSSLRCS
ncbi:hypothetical protein K474DRAFT_1590061 [Panus rudis PR-1116 ss-1]|nr:hypothetical protein K474DRAFT_1590061 [Panus rudis PR-1116 ss-1]